jgi:protoheme IX farnesyltransferase
LLKAFYTLTKPGIIYGNLITAAAGFLFAARFHIDWPLFISTLLGTAMVIGSACVFNNCIDRDIDRKMERTKERALVHGTITLKGALIYGTIIGLVGFLILALHTNLLVVGIGAVAFIDYVVFYGIAKRKTPHGTIVGSISGAAPIMAGYCAASGHLDGAAWLLFLILAFWQMPHFYAIAMYRAKEYKAAGIPVLPLRSGVRATKVHIILYVLGFGAANVALTLCGYAGYSYLVIMSIVSLIWLFLGFRGFASANSNKWARGMFFFSLLTVLILSAALTVGKILP